MKYALGLDIGTTSTIGILLGMPDKIIGPVSRPVTLSARHPGWAEEDPAQWWDNVCAITHELLEAQHVPPEAIVAVGVAGMLPAVVILDENGALIRPSIQQSDGRCGEQVRQLRDEVDESRFAARTGNGINQQIVATKLRWIAAHEPENFKRIATVFGSYDFINWKLTDERAIEQNWALEAGLTDLATHDIADDLVDLTGVPRNAVPRRVLSHQILGKVTTRATRDTGLAEDTLVIGGAADFIASALGAGIVNAGDVLLKFGGSVDILTATDLMKPDFRMFLDYHLVPGLFIPNGCMSTGGSALNWFASVFAGAERIEAERRGVSVHAYLDDLASACPPGADGLSILPYFLGEKTPIHDADARGVFEGLSYSHTIGHLWRALLESYAYALAHHVEVLNDMGHRTERFFASDGGSQSRIWMQIVADVLQRPVQRLKGHHGSCLGAAWTAAMGVGLAQDWSGVAKFVTLSERLLPNPANAAIYRGGYARYRDLYQRLSVKHSTALPV